MFHRESVYRNVAPPYAGSAVPPDWWCAMVEWMLESAAHLGISREVVGTAVCLQIAAWPRLDINRWGREAQKRRFQASVMAALLIAKKTHGLADASAHSLASPTELAELSRNRYSPRDVAACERAMLNAIGWRVNPVTCEAFVAQLVPHLLQVLPAGGERSPPGEPPPRHVAIRAAFAALSQVYLVQDFADDRPSEVALAVAAHACWRVRAPRSQPTAPELVWAGTAAIQQAGVSGFHPDVGRLTQVIAKLNSLGIIDPPNCPSRRILPPP